MEGAVRRATGGGPVGHGRGREAGVRLLRGEGQGGRRRRRCAVPR